MARSQIPEGQEGRYSGSHNVGAAWHGGCLITWGLGLVSYNMRTGPGVL